RRRAVSVGRRAVRSWPRRSHGPSRPEAAPTTRIAVWRPLLRTGSRPFHSKYRNVEDDAPAGQRMIEVDFDGALEDPAHYAGEMTAGGLEGDHHARLELHALEPAAVDELDVLG